MRKLLFKPFRAIWRWIQCLVRFLRFRWIKIVRGKVYKCKRCYDSGLVATGWDGYIQGRCSCPKGDKHKSKHGIYLF